jgi:hypothetical protein
MIRCPTYPQEALILTQPYLRCSNSAIDCIQRPQSLGVLATDAALERGGYGDCLDLCSS